MKKLSILVLMSLSTIAMANQTPMGAGSSGGGMVISCTSQSKEYVELLDIYEAKLNSKIIVMPSTGSLTRDYRRAYKNVMDLRAGNTIADSIALGNYIQKHLDGALKLVQWSDETLRSTQDQGKTIDIPNNCELKQVAIFSDLSHSMVVNKTLWNKMSTLSQAALLLHEEFFFDFRQLGDQTSEVSRSFVGQAVAQLGVESAYINKDGYSFQCFARNNDIVRMGATDFYLDVRDVGQGYQQLTLQFTSLVARDLLTKSISTFVVKDADIKPSLLDGLDYNKTRNVEQSTAINSLLGSGYVARLQLISNDSPKIEIVKDGVSLGKLEIRSCNQFH